MKTVILKSFKDENTGEIGLGIEGVPRTESTNAAMEGLLIAHDLIEHVNGLREIGSIGDELEALGAIWYVRGQHGELRRDHVGSAQSVEENIASDIVRMYRDHISGGQYVDLQFHRGQRAVSADDALSEIISIAAREVSGEFDEEERVRARAEWPPFERIALRRMREGYRKARRRWEREGHYAANNLFWTIAEAVTAVLKDIQCEGQQWKLFYGRPRGGSLSFRAWVNEEEFYT